MKLRTQLFIISSISIIVVSGAAGYFFYKGVERYQHEQLRQYLVAYAHAASMIIDGDKHERLTKAEDMDSPEFIEIRNQIREFMENTPIVWEAYTMVKTDKPNIYKFVIDAGIPEDEDDDGVISGLELAAPLGEEYDVSPYPEMQKAFEGPAVDREINRDKWGWWLSGYAPIYNSKGEPVAIVGLDVSAGTIREHRLRLAKIILLVCIFFAPAALLISNRFSHSLSKPIYRMVEAAKEIGRGNYSHRVGLSKKNEIGFLATTMDSMAENIKRSFDKLSTLNRTANILASTLELEQSLKISLNLVLEITRSNRGAIFLVNRNERNIEIALVDGIEARKCADDEYIVGSGRITTVLEEDRDAQVKRWLEVMGCTRCLPLTVNENLRGFFLLNPEIKDEEFIDTLMAQVSLAIENARLFHEAITDSLTELYLKRYLQIRLDGELSRSRRYKRALSFMMLDIDDFKEVNDTYGHLCGDIVLKELAEIVKVNVRAYDIVSRFGGEEIAIILPETKMDSAAVVAERIRDGIAKRDFSYEKKVVHVTISIGVYSVTGEETISSDDVVRRADAALYKAKQSGKNKVCLG